MQRNGDLLINKNVIRIYQFFLGISFVSYFSSHTCLFYCLQLCKIFVVLLCGRINFNFTCLRFNSLHRYNEYIRYTHFYISHQSSSKRRRKFLKNFNLTFEVYDKHIVAIVFVYTHLFYTRHDHHHQHRTTAAA